VRQIAALGSMRKGSVSEQFLETAHKDGSKTKRGPYILYTFKEKGRTISRRLPAKQKAQLFREQIDNFRRFQTLAAQLVRTSQRMADLAAADLSDEKKTPSP